MAEVGADGDPATLPTALVNTRSYAYQYDQLNRLIDAQMGQLLTSAGYVVLDTSGHAQVVQPDSSNGAPVPRTTHWNLDNLGNWSGGSLNTNGTINVPSVERLADWNNNGSADDDFPEKTHHAVDNANEIAVLYQESGNPPAGTPTALVYDVAGNLVYDGRYVYQYDGLNRLVQVNLLGGAQFDDLGRVVKPGPVTAPPTPVLGDLVCSYVYDGLGRLIRKRTPINAGRTNLQTKDFYYDGVRRIQEQITRPQEELLTYESGTFTTGGLAENDELVLQRADGLHPAQEVVEPIQQIPLSDIWTDRAYIYGPDYVDEFVAGPLTRRVPRSGMGEARGPRPPRRVKGRSTATAT